MIRYFLAFNSFNSNVLCVHIKQVEVTGGQVKIRGNKDLLKSSKLPGSSPCGHTRPRPTFLIVGGGTAFSHCHLFALLKRALYILTLNI